MKYICFMLLFCAHSSVAQLNFDNGFTLGGQNGDAGVSIVLDANGNAYCTGSYANSIDLDPGSGNLSFSGNGSMYLAKYDSVGSLLWGKAIISSTQIYPYAMDIDQLGYIYITGWAQGQVDFGGGAMTTKQSDIFVVKYDQAGQHIWSKLFGGNKNDHGRDIKVNDDGSQIAICGSFTDTIDFGNGNIVANGFTNAFIAQLDINGNALWSGGFGDQLYHQHMDVAIDNSGNIYLSGVFNGSATDLDPGSGIYIPLGSAILDIFISKFNSSGAFISANIISGEKNDTPMGLEVNEQGDVYLSGMTESDTLDVDTGPGLYNLYSSPGIQIIGDIFILKYNNAFNLEWGYRFGGRSLDTGSEIMLDGNGSVFLTGMMGDTIDFDPGAGQHILTGVPGAFAAVPFLAQYSESGTFIDAFSFHNHGQTRSVYAGSGKVWITGQYEGDSLDIDPGNAIYSIINSDPSPGSNDAFVAAYDYSNVSGINEITENGLTTYPSPFQDQITIRTDYHKKSEYILTDLSGKIQMQGSFMKQVHLSTSNLSSGIYILSVQMGDDVLNSKLVKAE